MSSDTELLSYVHLRSLFDCILFLRRGPVSILFFEMTPTTYSCLDLKSQAAVI